MIPADCFRPEHFVRDLMLFSNCYTTFQPSATAPCKQDVNEAITRAILFKLLTQLLCPSDGSACVCCIALCQIHHLWANLPPHQRIQTCGGRTYIVMCLYGQIWTEWFNMWLFCFTRYGRVRFAPRVDVHEGARSHGDLDITNVKAALSKHGCLLVRHLQ